MTEGIHIGNVWVDVLPDARGLREKLRRDLPRDVTVTVKARLEDKEAKARLAKIKADFGRAGGVLAGTTAIASAVGPALSAAVSATSALTSGVVALGGALAPATGLLGALPVALLAGGQAAGVLKLALNGVGTAAKNLEKAAGNPVKMAKALQALTPDAAALATTLAATKPAMDQLRESAQRGLFPGLGASLTVLTRLAPRFRGELQSTGAVLGGVAVNATGLLVARQGLLHDILRGNLPIIRDAGRAGLSLADALLHVVHSALPMTQAVAAATARLAEHVNRAASAGDATGKLAGFFDRAWRTGQQLGRILVDIGVGLGHVFRIGAQPGQALLDTVEKLTARFRDWSSSIRGTEAIGGWFARGQRDLQAMGRLLQSVSRNLGALGHADVLAPLLDKLSGPGGLIDAIGALVRNANASGALGAFADAVTSIVHAIGGLGGIGSSLTAFAVGLKLVADAAGFVVRNVPGATTALAAFLAVAGAKKALDIVGLGTVVEELGKKIKVAGKEAASASMLAQGFNDARVAASAFSGPMGTVGGLAAKAQGGLKAAAAGALEAVGGFGGLAVAGAVLGGAILLVNARLQSLRDAHDSANEAAGKLKATIDQNTTSLLVFSQANKNVISQLRGLDAAGQKSFLIQIGFNLEQDGLTPEQAFAAVQKVADVAGVKLPIGFSIGDLTDSRKQLDAIRDSAKRVVDQIQITNEGMVVIGEKAKEDLQGIAKSAAAAFVANDYKGGIAQIAAFEQATRSSGLSVIAQDAAIAEVNKDLLEYSKVGGVSTTNTHNLRDALGELSRSKGPQTLKDLATRTLAALGPTDDYTAAIDALIPKLVDLSAPGVAAALDRNAAATYNARLASDAVGASWQDAATKAADLKMKANDLTVAIQAMHDALIVSEGGTLDTKSAEAAVFAASEAFAQSEKKNGTSQDPGGGPGARENIAAAKALQDAWNAALDAIGKSSPTASKAKAEFKRLGDGVLAYVKALNLNADATITDTAKYDKQIAKQRDRITLLQAERAATDLSTKGGTRHAASLDAQITKANIHIGVLKGQETAALKTLGALKLTDKQAAEVAKILVRPVALLVPVELKDKAAKEALAAFKLQLAGLDGRSIDVLFNLKQSGQLPSGLLAAAEQAAHPLVYPQQQPVLAGSKKTDITFTGPITVNNGDDLLRRAKKAERYANLNGL